MRDELAALPPRGASRMSANPHANGGLLLTALELPDFRDYAVTVDAPGTGATEATRVLGEMLRDVVKRNPDTLPADGARRDRLQSPAGGVRDDRPCVGGRDARLPTITWRPTAA